MNHSVRFEKERICRAKHHGCFAYRKYIKYLLKNDCFTNEIINWIGPDILKRVKPRQALNILLHGERAKNISHGVEICFNVFNASITDLREVLLDSTNLDSSYFAYRRSHRVSNMNIDWRILPEAWLVWILRMYIGSTDIENIAWV